jgi:hypothetical protein
MDEDPIHLLASLYDPPLPLFTQQALYPSERVKAAAWGEAFQAWLEGYPNALTRKQYRRAVESLLSTCRKPPWQVRPLDVMDWLEEELAGRKDGTKKHLMLRARAFFRFASGRNRKPPLRLLSLPSRSR